MKLYHLVDNYLSNSKHIKVFTDGSDTLYVVKNQKLLQVSRDKPENVFNMNYIRTITCFPVVLFYQKLDHKKDYFPDIKDEVVCFCHHNIMLTGTYDEVFYDMITRIHKDRNYKDWNTVNV